MSKFIELFYTPNYSTSKPTLKAILVNADNIVQMERFGMTTKIIFNFSVPETGLPYEFNVKDTMEKILKKISKLTTAEKS